MTSDTGAHFGPGKLPLGVGGIVGDSFSILFRRFLTVILVSFVPMAFGLLASGFLVGWGIAFSGEATEADLAQMATGGLFWAKYALSMILQLVVYGFTTALLVQVAYDAKLDRTRRIGQYFGPALRAALPVAILMIAIGILTGLGAIALLIGALWVYAVFSVTTPAIVIEGAGFRGMGRSAALTKEYRWPIMGALLLVFLISMLLNVAVQFIVGLFTFPSAEAGSTLGIALLIVVMSILQSLTLGLSSITSALIFARLKEIKEGVSVDRLASVFE